MGRKQSKKVVLKPYVADGIEVPSSSIRVHFMFDGKRRREKLPGKPTQARINAAKRLRNEIIGKIDADSFTLADYVTYFPNSTFVRQLPVVLTQQQSAKQNPPMTFGEVADKWLIVKKPKIAFATWKDYRWTINKHFIPFWGSIPMRDISYDLVETHMATRNFQSGKTYNNVLIPLREILTYAHKIKQLPEDFGSSLESVSFQEPRPDPLTLEEVNQVIAHLRKTYPDFLGIADYFEVAFFTGERPSELIANLWQDFDQDMRQLRVERARVRGQIKVTKTSHARDIELHSRAFDTLIRQKNRTYGKHPSNRIFLNKFDRPFYDTNDVVPYWHEALQACNIRDRDARQTRHTFATLCLMAGCNPNWVAGQMGHASPEMFWHTYSKWINGADKKRELNKMESFVSESSDEGSQHDEPGFAGTL